MLVRAGVAYLLALERRLYGAVTEGEVCGVIREGLAGVGKEEWMRRVREAGSRDFMTALFTLGALGGWVRGDLLGFDGDSVFEGRGAARCWICLCLHL